MFFVVTVVVVSFVICMRVTYIGSLQHTLVIMLICLVFAGKWKTLNGNQSTETEIRK